FSPPGCLKVEERLVIAQEFAHVQQPGTIVGGEAVPIEGRHVARRWIGQDAQRHADAARLQEAPDVVREGPEAEAMGLADAPSFQLEEALDVWESWKVVVRYLVDDAYPGFVDGAGVEELVLDGAHEKHAVLARQMVPHERLDAGP